ncbi:hypothetical protein GJ496_004012 [Pomphorhynchus laevis]|nr:hypothetical protein GJ496_004012 [Pomphorhynchus laevis]
MQAKYPTYEKPLTLKPFRNDQLSSDNDCYTPNQLWKLPAFSRNRHAANLSVAKLLAVASKEVEAFIQALPTTSADQVGRPRLPIRSADHVCRSGLQIWSADHCQTRERLI